MEYDYSIYKLSFPAVQSLIVKEYAPNHVSKTIIKIIHLPYLKENNLSYILINEEKNWSGAELFISYDNKRYQLVVNTNRQSTYGNIIECIGENEWIVVLRSGKLKPMSLVIVGKGEKVEIIKVNNIEFIEKSKYKISNFIRAQLKTNKYEHIPGDDLVLFDESIISFEVEPTSKEFFLKAVTHGSVLFHTEPYVFSRNL